MPARARSVALASALFVALPPFQVSLPLGLDAYMPVPDDNPLSAEKVTLGRRLFSAPLLSADRTRSCATCHDPQRAFADGRPVAIGVHDRRGRRNTPTLLNRGYGRAFFWDGRVSRLEDQVLEPIRNPDELGLSDEEAVARLRRDRAFRQSFLGVFGDEPTARHLALALASYVRTIVSGDAPVDRYLAGNRNALGAAAREGLRLFRTKGNCIACHAGPNLTDEAFHNTGVAWRSELGVFADEGRFSVTRSARELGAFKTPTLREIASTGPYMHDGSMSSLEEVIEFYDRGGTPNPFLDPEIRPLHLTPDEKRALVAFLTALGGRIREGTIMRPAL